MRSKREKLGDCHTRRGDIQRQIQEVNVDSHTIDKSIDQARHRLAQLDSVPQQVSRIFALPTRASTRLPCGCARTSIDSASQCTSQSYSRSRSRTEIRRRVESCIPFGTLKTFVCQTRDDYDLFAAKSTTRWAFHVSAGEVEGFSLESFQPDVPREQLAALGFEDYALTSSTLRQPCSFICVERLISTALR